YGVKTGMFLLYIASLISATINFWISRKFGRKLVTKLVGEKSMREVDEFTSVEGKQILLISRLFGFPIFEFISYAAGLTNILFKEYFIITAIASIFTNVAAYLVFRNINFQSETGILVWIGSIVGAGIVFGFFIKSYLNRRRNISQ
ncbi:MAG: VTT domain-containing protein, partial [Patescibacteria group bacterium]|nr:VTT domain-containing protein [Patescibacteria group bacterium]